MLEAHAADPARAARERRIAAGVVVFLVLLRSLVLVFWEQAQFDSDQAITGLMAKHLSEFRAFPMFYYGQSYMLAVEAWLAAPVFVVAGVSVATLKLPLLGINIAIALLLLRTFERDTGLRPAFAMLAALVFVLPPPGTAARLLDANGGNVEPALYIILLWLTRARPVWGGLLLGIGFLQREFTIYGLVALLAIEALQGTLFTRAGIRRRLAMLRTAAEVWLLVQWLKGFSSAAGPGTTLANIFNPRDNFSELASRTCFNARAAVEGVPKLFTEHWPVLFGTRVLPLADFGIESGVSQGLPWSWVFPAAAMLVAIAGITWRLMRDRRWPQGVTFCAYLALASMGSLAGYVVGRCGQIEFGYMRYDLLSLVGAAAIGAWFLRTAPPPMLARAWMLLLAGWIGVAALPHARLLVEYVTHAPVGTKQLIVRNLEAQGIRYAVSDYWIAYAVTFLADERVIVASGDFTRIPSYNKAVAEHAGESVRISRTACVGGRTVAPGVYLCPP
ncbi:MAG TPA: hypothetical protein VM733_09820 [Thermoanaerobaculia bacterium]|nr:hypothetical protein [Thermoanaerobaculia bacterium]